MESRRVDRGWRNGGGWKNNISISPEIVHVRTAGAPKPQMQIRGEDLRRSVFYPGTADRGLEAKLRL